jgi:hypothetical protein
VSYYRALLLVVATAVSLPAAVVERMSLEGLVARSQVIAHARVARTSAAWDNLTGVIWTHSELVLQEGLKGRPGNLIRVSEPGGVVGEVGQSVEGMPRFIPGEEVVVFLYRTPQGLWRVRGLGQGKFTVLSNPTNSEQVVRSNMAGLTVVEGGHPAPLGISSSTINGMAFNDFKATVRALVDRGSNDQR